VAGLVTELRAHYKINSSASSRDFLNRERELIELITELNPSAKIPERPRKFNKKTTAAACKQQAGDDGDGDDCAG
jgi:hypothetical protein